MRAPLLLGVLLVACGGGSATTADGGFDASSDGLPPSESGVDAVAPDGGSGGGQSLVWVWNDYPNSLAAVFAHPQSFTHVSPTLYDVNYAYASGVAEFTSANKTDGFDGLTSTQIAQQIHAAGMKCVPLVYGGAANAGTDQGIHDILDDSPSGAQSAFITSMVGEAVAKGYDGYNLDWEVDSSQTTYAAYGAKLESFLAAFRSALHQHGMQLSFDLGTWYIKQTYCSGGNGVVDLTAIGANVDLAILEAYSTNLGTASTSCPASLANPQPCSDDFTSALNLMCVYMPNAAISIGFNANPASGSNDIAGAVVSTTQAYGIHDVAIWPDYNTDGPNGAYVFLDAKNIAPSSATWFQLLADFLSAQ